MESDEHLVIGRYRNLAVYDPQIVEATSEFVSQSVPTLSTRQPAYTWQASIYALVDLFAGCRTDLDCFAYGVILIGDRS